MDGQAYLERLISDQLGGGAGGRADARASWMNLAELRGVAQGLVAAGALDAEVSATILADLTATLDELGWLPHVRFSTSTSTTAGLRGASRDGWRDLAERPPSPTLVDVQSLTGRAFTIGASEYSLIALERWTTLFRVTYSWQKEPPHEVGEPPSSAPRFLHWSASDDRGRTYPAQGGGSSGFAVISFGGQIFAPGLDPDAGHVTLSIRADDDAVTVPIELG